MASVSRAAFVSLACRDESTKRSTNGAAWGWVQSRQPPATLRSTIPAPRCSYSAASSSSAVSTLLRSTSRVWASAPGGSGSSVTNRTASTACRISSASATGLSPLDLDSSLGTRLDLVPLHLDLPERLGLGEFDLPFTVKLEEGQEPHHDVDPVLAIGDEIPEHGRSELADPPLEVSDRLRDRRPDRRHVGQVHHRRRAPGRRRRLRQTRW